MRLYLPSAIAALIASTVAVTATAISSGTAPASLLVKTSKGAVLGTSSEYRDGVSVFKGIPFAAPPTGSLRWQPPADVTSWSDTYNATVFGAECAQSYSTGGIFSSGSKNIAEDCLYLNVWRPESATSASNLPVYVWIYGGRFEGGAGSVPTYDGSGLAIHDVVVVTLNYRMGPFGFLAHPDLSSESDFNSSGNYGLLDQLFALQWVQDEIAAFGGNPKQVTVGGQSAGSASALDMMYSPLGSGLIAGVVSESGARAPHDPETAGLATSYRTKAAAESSGVSFLAEMNVSTIAELRNVPMDTLLEADNDFDTILQGTIFENSSAIQEPPLWRPVIDGYVLLHGYGESLKLDAHSDVPILTGANSGEASSDSGASGDYSSEISTIMGNLTDEYLALYPSNNDTQASDSSTAFWLDISRVGLWIWASEWAAGGAKSNVYTYFWTHAPPNQTAGAYHGSELWYVFNNIPYGSGDRVPTTWGSDDLAIETQMSKYWINFIKSGNPNGGDLTHFPPTTKDSTKVMWLGDQWGADSIADDLRINFIKKWFSTLKEW
ncbi:hypothetical protein V502_06242 [Pseudogymnoascus sp. VKM F-4520 (FW-2644)]|nr:hypothetical protein V502_06242 [Pseudogymnoascus sp. VKM F-4520 (FW-2644)]